MVKGCRKLHGLAAFFLFVVILQAITSPKAYRVHCAFQVFLFTNFKSFFLCKRK